MTIYSTVCACCNRVVLSDRKIPQTSAANGEVTVVYGGRFVFLPSRPDELCEVLPLVGPEMRMLPLDAEMWLVQPDEATRD
jgi:hypothetical protein